MPVYEAGYNVLQLLQWALCKQRTEQLVTNVSFLVKEKSLQSREKKNHPQPIGLSRFKYVSRNDLMSLRCLLCFCARGCCPARVTADKAAPQLLHSNLSVFEVNKSQACGTTIG